MSHNTVSPNAATTSAIIKNPTQQAIAGAAGGVVGGIVFGMMMAMMGMLPVIASMMGSSSAVVGFLIHMAISVFFGLVLTFAGFRFLTTVGSSAVTGVVYGVILWVVGPLLIMPLMMNMPVFAINQGSMMSLMGHVIFGVLAAVVAHFVARSRA